MASSSSERKRRRWISSDAVDEIISHLSSSGDRVRFAAVSATWRCSSSSAAKSTRHPPWVMLPGPREEKDDHRSLYSFSERKLYHIRLPQIQGQQCVGSGKGWIITVNNLNGNLQLLHLLTGSVTSLPSVTTFSDVRSVGGGGVFNRNMRRRKGYMCRYSRSSDPAELEEEFRFLKLEHMYSFYHKAVFFPSASLVFVIYNTPSRLAFARLGVDHSWNEFDIDCICIRDVASRLGKGRTTQTDCCGFGDVVFHKGQFYTTVLPGWIMALDLYSTPPRCACLHLKPPPKVKAKEPYYVLTSYLVESPDGAELMQVWRIVYKKYCHLTNAFIVFKCKVDNDPGEEACAKWVEVICLDEQVLFLGGNLSLALSTKDFPELTPNSIYFSHGDYLSHGELHQLDMGVFHLESRTIDPLLFPNNERLPGHMTTPLPVWIPHTECFPVVTQIAKVEDITKRAKVKFETRQIEVDGRIIRSVPHHFLVKTKWKFDRHAVNTGLKIK